MLFSHLGGELFYMHDELYNIRYHLYTDTYGFGECYGDSPRSIGVRFKFKVYDRDIIADFCKTVTYVFEKDKATRTYINDVPNVNDIPSALKRTLKESIHTVFVKLKKYDKWTNAAIQEFIVRDDLCLIDRDIIASFRHLYKDSYKLY